MAQPVARNLARLTRLHRFLEERQELCDELRNLLEPLERAGLMTVAGEAWMVSELRERLEKASSILDGLREIELSRAAIGRLDQAKALLADIGWDTAGEIRGELERKHKEQDEIVGSLRDRLGERQGQIRSLRDAVEEGRRARAPVVGEERRLLRLEGLAAAAERALREQRFTDLAQTLAQLDADPEAPAVRDHGGPPVSLIDRIRRKTEEARRFARQADLLLLRSPLSADKRYEYTVLLRTPSEPGSHGINIQGSSTLVEQDRQQMADKIDEMTRAIDLGLARRDQGGTDPESVPEASPLRRYHYGDEVVEDLEPVALNPLVQDLGDFMYRLFMPEPMQSYLLRAPFSLTITTNDLELPWELMFGRNEFLCLNRPLARMPMGRAFPRLEPRRVEAGKKLRFLLIYADPENNLPGARREIEKIEQELRAEWKDQIEIDVVAGEEATGRALNKVLRSGGADVIHYAGHAAFDHDEADLSGLLLHEREVFFAQKARRLLEGRPLIFLNACDSARTANEKQPQDYLQKPAEGLASAFIYGGALGCIGSLWPVYDDAAAELALKFYDRVVEGYMIGEAMRLARRSVKETFPNQITWASFVLYGDPTFRLVD